MVINQFINEFLTYFRLVVVDPNHDNIHAIQCYEKARFEQANCSKVCNLLDSYLNHWVKYESKARLIEAFELMKLVVE